MKFKHTPLTPTESETAIERFRTFLRFPTVAATAVDDGSYSACAEWLLERTRQVCDEAFVLPESPPGAPIVVGVWRSAAAAGHRPILLLNSHYDVVPADEADWTVPPFEGIRQNGRIYGRGTQDMKCVCIQYLEAIAKIRSNTSNGAQVRPQRDVYLTFVPDEEVGGSGMAAFLSSELYKSLPGIALALDEGLASTDDTFSVFYGERLPWWVDVIAEGPTGHGSRFIDNTAVEQLVELANKALAFRQGQRSQLGLDDHTNCAHAVAAAQRRKQKTLGDVTTLNITTLQAGVRAGNDFAYNCVPPVAKCSLDIRISPHEAPSNISGMLDTWCRECSSDPDHPTISWQYIKGQGNPLDAHAVTSTDPAQNPWYRAFAAALIDDLGISIVPQVFPAATDSRFLRAMGVRALGFSPMRQTEILLHENDEYIPEVTFLEGIEVYRHLLYVLAMFEEEDG